MPAFPRYPHEEQQERQRLRERIAIAAMQALIPLCDELRPANVEACHRQGALVAACAVVYANALMHELAKHQP